MKDTIFLMISCVYLGYILRWMQDMGFNEIRGGKHMRRIRKDQARKRYNAGEVTIIVPCKIRPDNPWGFRGYLVNDPARDFDSYVNEFEYYSCTAETGRYAAFYIPETEANA